MLYAPPEQECLTVETLASHDDAAPDRRIILLGLAPPVIEEAAWEEWV